MGYSRMLQSVLSPVFKQWQVIHSCTWSQLLVYRQSGFLHHLQVCRFSSQKSKTTNIVLDRNKKLKSQTDSRSSRYSYKKKTITSFDAAVSIDDGREQTENGKSGALSEADFSRDEGHHMKKRSKDSSVRNFDNLPDDWTEKFGTLAEEYGAIDPDKFYSDIGAHNLRHEEEIEMAKEEPDFHDHVPLARYNRKHIPDWYTRRIKKLVSSVQIKEALDLFEEIMIKKDRVKPDGYAFFLLISALAQIGYTKKAFQLYNMMINMGIYVEPPIYTCLFTACANSPFNDGLTWARKLYTRMLLKDIKPEYVTYLSMIRAFGMGGEINTAFSLADVAASKFLIKEDMLNSLLITCISDKENGFRHALLVWRKFKQLGIKPDIMSYNLLLRAVKECGIVPTTNARSGELWKFNEQNLAAIQQIESDFSSINSSSTELSIRDATIAAHPGDILTHKEHVENDNLNKLSSSESVVASDITNERDIESEHILDTLDTCEDWWQLDAFPKTSALSVTNSNSKPVPLSRRRNFPATEKLPNLLDPREKLGSAVSVRAVETAEDRILLLGGCEGFLNKLEQDGVKADVVTYSQLLMVVPSHQELNLLSHMRDSHLKPDIDFYNHYLQKKGNFYMPVNAKEMLSVVREDGLVPNMMTYSLLASHCRTLMNAQALLEDMKSSEMVPNVVVMTSLVKASYMDFSYKWSLLTLMDDLSIEPDTIFIETIERQIRKAKDLMILKERGKIERKRGTHFLFSPTFPGEFQDFLRFYDKWAESVPMKKEKHPWQHFQKDRKQDKGKTDGQKR